MSNKTIAEFLEHHKQFSHFRPASREEAGFFYSEPDQALDEALCTVGHLRMDFGSGGKEFFHTWWPHNEDQFNTGEFKDDLQEVVDALRADGPLKDLTAMSAYCHRNGGAITQDGRSYGYIAETKHYRYCLRCTPSPGDYQGYLYCYDLRQQQMAYVHLWNFDDWSIQTEDECFSPKLAEGLPEMCFSTLQSTGELICIKRGETGYYPSQWNTGDKEKNVELADQLNEQLGVNMWQRQAMEVGSMCGWDVPGADPAKYQEDYVQTGAPAEAQHSGFGGERSSGEMSEPCPQDEAKDME